ncbi:MAG: TetR/AcrR family transcriptional regulator [Acidobacteriota bacterium]
MNKTTNISSKRLATPKGAKKRSYHHGNLKEAIISAALKLVAKRGPRGFTLSEAAQSAGVSVAAPYRHFADKEALLATIAEEGFARLGEVLASASTLSNADPLTRLIDTGVAYVHFAIEKPAHFLVMFESGIDKKRYPGLLNQATQAFEILTSTVKEVIRGSGETDAETLTAAAWSLMHGLAVFVLDDTFSRLKFQKPTEVLVQDSMRVLLHSKISRPQ